MKKLFYEVAQKAMILVTGRGLGQMITLLSLPFITRLYSPEDFGIFGICAAVASIFATIASGRYELAILRNYSKQNALRLIILALSIVITTVIALLVIISLLKIYPPSFLNKLAIAEYLLIIPPMILSISASQTFSYFIIRQQKFTTLAHAKIINAIITQSIMIIGGVLTESVWGLLLGPVIGYLCEGLFLGSNILFTQKLSRNLVNTKYLKALARKYKAFPTLNMPSALFDVFANNAYLLLFSYFFGKEATGFLQLTKQFIGGGYSLLSTSYGLVFAQKLHTLKSQTLQKHVHASILGLSLLAITSYLCIVAMPAEGYALIFSEKWAGITTYLKIIALFFALQFILSALSFVFVKLDKHKFLFKFWLFDAITSLTAISIMYLNDYSVFMTLIAFTLTKCALQVLMLKALLKYVRH